MVEHVAIADADRHEVRHASTASNRQVLTSNGDGTTEFAFVDYANLQNVPLLEGYKTVLSGFSVAVSQGPAATGVAYQIEFGGAQTTADVDLSAAGVLTFNEPGDYLITLFLRLGRTTGAGTAIVFNRLVYNGVQTLNSNSFKLSDQDVVIPFSANLLFSVNPGDTLSTQIMRDPSGINNGGLFQLSPTALGWNPSPSASVLVAKYVGAV